jgi:hypothetical protein
MLIWLWRPVMETRHVVPPLAATVEVRNPSLLYGTPRCACAALSAHAQRSRTRVRGHAPALVCRITGAESLIFLDGILNAVRARAEVRSPLLLTRACLLHGLTESCVPTASGAHGPQGLGGPVLRPDGGCAARPAPFPLPLRCPPLGECTVHAHTDGPTVSDEGPDARMQAWAHRGSWNPSWHRLKR